MSSQYSEKKIFPLSCSPHDKDITYVTLNRQHIMLDRKHSNASNKKDRFDFINYKDMKKGNIVVTQNILQLHLRGLKRAHGS